MSIASRRESTILLLGDILVLYAALWLTLLFRYQSVPDSETLTQHIVPFSILFLIWTIVFATAGLYSRYVVMFRKNLAPLLLQAQGINISLATIFFFLTPFVSIAPKTNLIIYLGISLVLLFIWRAHIFPVLRSRRLRRVLVVGVGEEMLKLADTIHNLPNQSLEVAAFLNLLDTSYSANVVNDIISSENISIVILDTSHVRATETIPVLLNHLFLQTQLTIVDAHSLFESMFGRLPLSMISDEWIMTNISFSSNRVYDLARRVTDLCAGLFGLVLSLPLYPIIIVAIKLEDGGPIFIKQERVGLHNRPIKIVKFRSMTGSDSGNQVLHSQLVVTKIGRILRSLRLDELPQFINIIKGDLSLVGPRPELPALVAHYAETIPYYNLRHLIKPGLTGWAQILQERHPHHGTDIEASTEKLAYDLFYLKQRSFLLDLYIALQTAKIVISRAGR